MVKPADCILYSGMSYEQASREGARLIAEANKTGAWHRILDRLTFLRTLMQEGRR